MAVHIIRSKNVITVHIIRSKNVIRLHLPHKKCIPRAEHRSRGMTFITNSKRNFSEEIVDNHKHFPAAYEDLLVQDSVDQPQTVVAFHIVLSTDGTGVEAGAK